MKKRGKNTLQFHPRIKGLLLVIIGSMLWGISGTVAQYLFQEKGFSPEWLVDIRLLASGLILLLYASVKGSQDIWTIWKSKHNVANLILFGILGMLGVQYTYFSAINYSNAATATILQYLSPVLITCYLAVHIRRIPNRQEIAAIVLAMIGTFLIVTKGNIHSLSISEPALFWGIGSAFAVAFYTLQSRPLLSKWSSIIVVGWGMLIGGAALCLIHQPWHFTGHWSITSIISVIFVIVFGTIIAFQCYLTSLKYIQPTEASILSSFEPLSAAFLSILWLHVTFSTSQWLGTICIIVTVIILALAK
jgi:drug/metabolite transporter (DMT)-like permease